MTKDPPVKYQKDRIYTFKQFELLNDWLKTNELVIDKTPINHFELDSKGRLIPIPQTPIFREAVVGNIFGPNIRVDLGELPKSLWGLAMSYSVYMANRLPHMTLGGKCLIEIVKR